MTTESGADSEPKTQQEKSKETEKDKEKKAKTPQHTPAAAAAASAEEPASPRVQLPIAAGHSTPARKEQVSQSPNHQANAQTLHSETARVATG